MATDCRKYIKTSLSEKDKELIKALDREYATIVVTKYTATATLKFLFSLGIKWKYGFKRSKTALYSSRWDRANITLAIIDGELLYWYDKVYSADLVLSLYD